MLCSLSSLPSLASLGVRCWLLNELEPRADCCPSITADCRLLSITNDD